MSRAAVGFGVVLVLGCAEARHARVVFEAAAGVTLDLRSLEVTARFGAREESSTLAARKLPADLVVLIDDGAGELVVSALGQSATGAAVASGSNSIAVEAGGSGRVAELIVTLAPGSDAGCRNGIAVRGETCYEPSWVRVDGRIAGAAVVDVDGDGIGDLVAGGNLEHEGGPRGLSVQRGLGADRFDAPTRIEWNDMNEWNGAEVVTGDLDGNGLTDVVLGGSYDMPALFALGTEGGFGVLQPLQEDTRGQDPRIADLDGDGALDVVTHAGHFVWAFLGDGQSAPTMPSSSFNFSAETYAMDAGELDSRPGAEVVVSSIQVDGRDQHLTVLGLVGGELQERAGLEEIPSPQDIAVVELDGSPPAEIVTSDFDRLYVLRSSDDLLELEEEMVVPASPLSPALTYHESITAVRREGEPDDLAVALTGYPPDNPGPFVTVVLLRPVPGTRQLSEHGRTNLFCSRGFLHAGDTDGDGRDEILVTCNSEYGFEDNGIVVLHVTDDGLEVPHRGDALGDTIDVGDVDGDARPDLVYALDNDVFALLGADGESTQSVRVGEADHSFRAPVAADLDGDGRDEIAAVCPNCGIGQGAIHRWTRGTLGSWSDDSIEIEDRDPENPDDGRQPQTLRAVHLVPDDPPRLVAGLRNGSVVAWGPDGLRSASSAIAAGGSTDVRLDAGPIDDVPGDDVVGAWVDARAVVLFRGDGGGGLEPGIVVAETIGDDGGEPGPIAVGDVDDDGRAEIVLAARRGRDVLVLGVVEGEVQEIASFAVDVEVDMATALDLDGIGGVELIFAGDPAIHVYDLTSEGLVSRLTLPGSNDFWDQMHAWGTPPILWTTARTERGGEDWRPYVVRYTPRP